MSHVDHTTIDGYESTHILADGCELCDRIAENAPFSMGYLSDAEFSKLHRALRTLSYETTYDQRARFSRNDFVLIEQFRVHATIESRLERLRRQGDR